MFNFLPAHINCLESQVETYSAAPAMNRLDVEELMSIFVSLAGELEKSVAKENLSAPHAATADFKRLAAVGSRIRSMATQMRKEGHTMAAIDPFVRSVIRCRDLASSGEIAEKFDQADRGENASRPSIDSTSINS